MISSHVAFGYGTGVGLLIASDLSVKLFLCKNNIMTINEAPKI